MKRYELSMRVSVAKEFESEADAIEWIQTHTVFDLLDQPGCEVGGDMIADLPERNLVYVFGGVGDA